MIPVVMRDESRLQLELVAPLDFADSTRVAYIDEHRLATCRVDNIIPAGSKRFQLQTCHR